MTGLSKSLWQPARKRPARIQTSETASACRFRKNLICVHQARFITVFVLWFPCWVTEPTQGVIPVWHPPLQTQVYDNNITISSYVPVPQPCSRQPSGCCTLHPSPVSVLLVVGCVADVFLSMRIWAQKMLRHQSKPTLQPNKCSWGSVVWFASSPYAATVLNYACWERLIIAHPQPPQKPLAPSPALFCPLADTLSGLKRLKNKIQAKFSLLES